MTSRLRRKRRITAARPSTSISAVVRAAFSPLLGLGIFCLAAVFFLPAQAKSVETARGTTAAYSVGRNGAKLKWLPARPSRTEVLTRLAQHTEPVTGDASERSSEDARPDAPSLREAPGGSERFGGPADGGTQGDTVPLPGAERYQLPAPSGFGVETPYRSPDASPPSAPAFEQFRGRQTLGAPPALPESPAAPTAPEDALEIEKELEVDALTVPRLERPRAIEEDQWEDDTRRGRPLESYLDTMQQQPFAGDEDDCKPPRDVPITEIFDMLDPPKGRGARGDIYPPDCPMKHETFEPRHWAGLTYTWKASGLCHKPLYFEDVQLERYGHSWGPYLQPIISGGHFFLNVPILPYNMGLEPPCECMYTLGYYRPGSCAPYMLDPIPLSVRAALFQGGVWTGMSYVIP